MPGGEIDPLRHTFQHPLKALLKMKNRRMEGGAKTMELVAGKRILVCGIKQLISVGMTILRRLEGLLNYYLHKITNGSLEELNNKIKMMKRQAYGFRDVKNFKLRLYDLHSSKYAFTE